MLSFLQRAFAERHSLPPPPEQVSPRPAILAITADLAFYSCILNAACHWNWTADWASSMTRGLEICESKPVGIVIYDRNLPCVDWRYAFDRLSSAAADARIFLAAPRVDEDLWRMVLRQRGYDVLARSASSEQLKRELRFAWLSLREAPV